MQNDMNAGKRRHDIGQSPRPIRRHSAWSAKHEQLFHDTQQPIGYHTDDGLCHIFPNDESSMATLAEALSSALQHHQAGNLVAAERIYRQILEVDPHDRSADRGVDALETVD
jgi:hypothetical protein